MSRYPVQGALIVWLISAFSLAAPAATFYVAVNGSTNGDGSFARTWPSVEAAVSRCGGGNTIVLMPGVYYGGIRVPKEYSGTESRPTVFRSHVKWKAKLVGAAEHGFATGDQ